MTNPIADISLRKAALIAGFGYLMVFIVATFANAFALESLIVAGDATATVKNIMANQLLFRFGIAGWVIVLAFDLIVAWALYILLEPINKSLSLLAAWFRLLFVAIFASGLVNLLSVLELLSGADFLVVSGAGQLQAQAMLFLHAYEYGVTVSFVFFGLHIFFIGFLIFKSGYIPKILGVLLLIASLGYLIDSFGNFLSTSYAKNEAAFILFVAVPAVISEFSLTLWLLFKGGKVQPTQ